MIVNPVNIPADVEVAKLPSLASELPRYRTSHKFSKKDGRGRECDRIIYKYVEGIVVRWSDLHIDPVKGKAIKDIRQYQLKPGISHDESIFSSVTFDSLLFKKYDWTIKKFFSPYRIDEVRNFAANKAIIVTEGEKDCESLRQQGLVASTFMAKCWTLDGLKHNIQMLRDNGISLLIFWPDDDLEGLKKANKVGLASAMAGVPCLILKPRLFWRDLPRWERKIVNGKQEKNGSGFGAADYFQNHNIDELIAAIDKQHKQAIGDQQLGKVKAINYEEDIKKPSPNKAAIPQITISKELVATAKKTNFDLLDFVWRKDRDLIELGSIPGTRYAAYKILCHSVTKIYNYLISLGLATKNTPFDLLTIWAKNSRLSPSDDSYLAAFNMLASVGSETLDPTNSLDKVTIDKVAKTLAFYCKREKISNPLEIDDQPKLDPVKTSLRFSDLSKSTHLSWARFSESCDPLYIVFGNDDLFPAIPMVAIPDVKQTNQEYINYDIREGLKPYIGNKREINIDTKNAKQWTKPDFVNLAKFVTTNNGSKNKVNDCQLTIDDQDMFDYLADDLIDNHLSLNSLDICFDDRNVDVDQLIGEIEKRHAKNIYFEAPHGLGKTTFSTALSTYFWELFNIATVVVTPTISLRKNCGVGYKLPQVDESFWMYQNPKNFRGCVTCLDSLFTRVMPLLEEHDIKYILIFDECSKNISHLHVGDTHIKKDRALHLSKVEKLLNSSELNVFLDADIYQSVVNYIQRSAPRNSLKIGTSFKFNREFVLWDGSSPKDMLKAVHLIRLNEPNATINVNSQSAKFDATYTPKNIANALMDMGIWFEDIVVHDGENLEPDHPGFDILSKPKHVQEAYFSKFCKGKIVITNQNFFSSGVSVASHCFDYQFNIFYNQGLPTDALQIPLRLRDKQGLQRHIWVANTVLGSSTLTGYTPKQVEEQLKLKIQYFDKGYERLRGYYNPADLVRSALSSQYMYEMIALESNLKIGSMFRRVVLRLIKHKQNWTLLDANDWIDKYKSGIDKYIVDRVYSPKTEIGQSDLYSAIKKSQAETVEGKNSEVAIAQLISDDEYKELINKNQKFSNEEEILLDRYQFNKSCLGVIPNPTKDDIQLWRDGFWRKLKSEFSLLIDRFWYTRVEESIKLEKSAKNKHFFEFDWVKKSDLPRSVYLRELGLDQLIREKYWLEIGSIKFESAKFINSPNQEFTKEADVNGVKITVNFTGTRLDLSKGSLLHSIAEKIANEPLKAKNLLGFKPEKTTLAIIRQVLDIFGHKIETVGNGKATKYVLIRDDNQELRNLYHRQIRNLVGLSAFSENNPYSEFIDELVVSNNEPVTLDAKAIKAAIPQVDFKSQFNLADLVDIGEAALEGEVSFKLVPSFP
jgi:hypothetical protein